MSINKKLFELQKSIGAITKDSVNPHFKNRYFDINTLLAEIKPKLIEQNLLLTQVLVVDGGNQLLETKLTCVETNESVSGFMLLPAGVKPQDMGSAITYFRRYSLQSMLGLEAEDDDGNTASSVSFQAQKPAPKPIANAANDKQAVEKFVAGLEQPTTAREWVDKNAAPLPMKNCPVCKKDHWGTYPKCRDCWKLEQK